jgi:hypothetical protein
MMTIARLIIMKSSNQIQGLKYKKLLWSNSFRVAPIRLYHKGTLGNYCKFYRFHTALRYVTRFLTKGIIGN